MKGKCKKFKTKSLVPNHSYCTRFRLQRVVAINHSLSFEKVFEHDHAAENQFFFCNKKRMKTCLPKDIIFNVLVFLPAKFVFEVIRFVCWEWYHMVKEPVFVTAHLQVSPVRVLFQYGTRHAFTCHVEANNGGLAITKLVLPFPAKFCSSLDGLILLQDEIDREGFHIVNLVTGVKKTLPRFGGLPMALFSEPHLAKALKRGHAGFWSILACTSGGQYKVVCVAGNAYVRLHVLVCTVGVDDAWRVMEHVPYEISRYLFFRGRHSVAGFVYWFLDRFPVSFAFDVDAEIVYKFYPPKNCGRYPGTYVKMMKTMGYINYIYSGGEIWWWLWELTDVKSSKWTKVLDINMGDLSSRLEPNFSISSEFMFRAQLYLTNGDLWVCLHSKVDESCVLAVYNIRSGNVLLHKRGSHCERISPYVNSLVKSC